MDIQQVRENLELLPDAIYTAEVEFVKAKGQLDFMQEMKKHLLATLKTQETGSNADRETKAMASQEYYNHLKGLKEAVVIAGVLAAEHNKLKNQFEAARSLNKNIV